MNSNDLTIIWSQGGGGPSRRACFASVIQPRNLQRLALRGGVQAAAVCDAAGRIYVADLRGSVYCFDRAGNALWSIDLQGGVVATPAFWEEKAILFVGTLQGWLYAIEAPTALIKWKRELPTDGDPRIVGDILLVEEKREVIVVVGSWGGRFWQIDGRSGEVLAFWDGGYLPSGPAAADRDGRMWFCRAMEGKGIELVCRMCDGQIVALSCYSSGPHRRQWTMPGPVIDIDRGIVLFIANGIKEARIEWIEVTSGRTLGHFLLDATACAAPAIDVSGRVIVADMAGRLNVIRPEGIEQRFEMGEDYLLSGCVSDEAGNLWLGTPTGVVYHVSLPDRKVQAVAKLPRAIVGRLSVEPSGRLLVPCMDRSVYRL